MRHRLLGGHAISPYRANNKPPLEVVVDDLDPEVGQIAVHVQGLEETIDPSADPDPDLIVDLIADFIDTL